MLSRYHPCFFRGLEGLRPSRSGSSLARTHRQTRPRCSSAGDPGVERSVPGIGPHSDGLFTLTMSEHRRVAKPNRTFHGKSYISPRPSGVSLPSLKGWKHCAEGADALGYSPIESAHLFVKHRLCFLRPHLGPCRGHDSGGAGSSWVSIREGHEPETSALLADPGLPPDTRRSPVMPRADARMFDGIAGFLIF